MRRVHDRRIGFNTLLIGGNERAIAIHQEIEGLHKSPGNRFVGFVNVNGGDQHLTESGLPRLGRWDELRTPIPNTVWKKRSSRWKAASTRTSARS